MKILLTDIMYKHTIFEHIKEIYYNILLVKTTQIILLCVAYFLHAKQNK